MSALPAHNRQSIEITRDTVARWLLYGPAQLREAAHAGGVAGVVTGNGSAEYVYPEITGYYLQWLAWYAASRGHSTQLLERAKAAQSWLRTWLHSEELPATRVHVRVGADDWRNGAIFFFDVAMVVRGLASAARQELLEPDPVVLRDLSELLARLIAEDGMFAACLKRDTNAALPERWSTRRGGFLAKAAAGILSAAHDLPMAANIVTAAEDTFVASCQRARDAPHDHTHALLYAIEGCLSMNAHPAAAQALPSLRRQLAELLCAAQRGGHVPESRATGAARLDIAAQALRAARLLWARATPDGPDRCLLPTLVLLVRCVGPDGTVPFNLGASPPLACVWAAMFAEQALALAQCDDGAPALSRCREYLV